MGEGGRKRGRRREREERREPWTLRSVENVFSASLVHPYKVTMSIFLFFKCMCVCGGGGVRHKGVVGFFNGLHFGVRVK